jgi:hypothetical protein
MSPMIAVQVPLYDLRSPLGVAPAALTASHPQPQPGGADAQAAPSHHLLLKAVGALTEAQLPPSLIAARAFATSRAQLRAKVASSGQVGQQGTSRFAPASLSGVRYGR